jgi:hypothetical protein
MAQDLTVNIKTTSDVPQAMDKSKSAVVSFSKQIEDIQKKFSTGFKDIFLGFTAPMVLLQGAIAYISKSMEEAKRQAKEGLDLIASGESKLSSSEEKRAANFFKRRKEMEEEKNLVAAGRQDITRRMLMNEGGEFKDFNIPESYVRKLREGSESIESLSRNKDIQRYAMEFFAGTDKGKEIEASLAAEKAAAKTADFKGPEGFGNVIGVGPNPVMEAMNAQLEEAKKQTAALERIAAATPGALAPDFTKIATT